MRRTITLVLIAVLISAAIPATLAYGDDGSPKAPKSSTPSVVLLQPRPATEMVHSQSATTLTTNAASAGTTNGCVGKSDNIHGSGSAPGLVIAKAWLACPIFVAQIEIWARLYKWNCVLIFFCGWSQVGSPDYQIRSGPTSYDEAYAVANCVVGGGDYLAQADHKVLGYDGLTYWAFTGQPSTHIVC
jgi:hypothetical protein